MKDGRVKLDALEIRVGKFFVKREEAHMKSTDMNRVFSFRVGLRMPLGAWMERIWLLASKKDGKALNTLNVYLSTMWTLFSVAPDDEFMQDAIRAADSALKRHPDWYGIKPEDGEEGRAAE